MEREREDREEWEKEEEAKGRGKKDLCKQGCDKGRGRTGGKKEKGERNGRGK